MTTVEEVAALKQQLSQRDEIIAMMKNKTREFVNKLKEEHSEEIRSLQLVMKFLLFLLMIYLQSNENIL